MKGQGTGSSGGRQLGGAALSQYCDSRHAVQELASARHIATSPGKSSGAYNWHSSFSPHSELARQGTAQVEVRALSPGEPARHAYEAVAAGEPQAPAPVAEAPPPSAIDALVDALPIASAAAGERPAPSVPR